ncbi:MAG: efflux RND transporter periplasmic adaptor subunit [Acidobacteriota bacterium]|nr:efflux RND transporter periplasmic adaptor subunit [Acidobacteriota bacterium]
MVVCIVILLLTGATVLAVRAYKALRNSQNATVPTARVQRGNLTLTITARGDLRGQHPEMLIAPMTGGGELHITSLSKPGSLAKEGDTIVQFDTTEQEYKLKEAQADLAEAQQHILQAKAQQQAQDEEDQYALLKASSDVKLAELDVRKNPLLATIVARQNELALSAARDHLEQLRRNIANRAATNTAATLIQEAGKAKAESQATTARQNIDAMTLKAHHAGYVSIQQNSNTNFGYFGMKLPLFQLGDAVRPGMAVAEIPDLKNWEVQANIGELDRGHIAIGDTVAVQIVAVPNSAFTGHVKDIGGTGGPPWDRRFSCRLSLDQSSPQLRPGMSTTLIITTDRLQNVLWLPAQALFENDGRTFVYARSGSTFNPKDVKLVRRNETRVVVSGLAEGQVVALADPLETATKKETAKSALSSVPK